MPEILKEAMQKREEQLKGVKNLFVKIFGDYYDKYKELPNLVSEKDISIFVSSRPEVWRTIQKQDLVLKDVAKIALEILEEKKRKLEIKEKAA